MQIYVRMGSMHFISGYRKINRTKWLYQNVNSVCLYIDRFVVKKSP